METNYPALTVDSKFLLIIRILVTR